MINDERGSRWTTERAQTVREMLGCPWINPGVGALAIDRTRGTVHNMMRAGEIRFRRLPGSRNRLAHSGDLLIVVLADMITDQESGADMGACSSDLIAAVRAFVETNVQANGTEPTPETVISLDVAVRRALIHAKRIPRTNRERTANEPRTANRER